MTGSWCTVAPFFFFGSLSCLTFEKMVVVRGLSTNRASSFGKVGLSALQYDLPFKVRRAKLQTLSGQDFVKYGELASNPIFGDWHSAFAVAPSLLAEGSVGALHEKLRRFDLSRYGAIELTGFVQALALAEVPLDESGVRDLFSDLDVRGLGKVDIEMFCLLVDFWKHGRQGQGHARNNSAEREDDEEGSTMTGAAASAASVAAASQLRAFEEDVEEGGDLFAALGLLAQRKEAFLKCCLQLGGEEYANQSSTAAAAAAVSEQETREEREQAAAEYHHMQGRHGVVGGHGVGDGAGRSVRQSNSSVPSSSTKSKSKSKLWCGPLSGVEVWLACRHCGVPCVGSLQRDLVAFALNTCRVEADLSPTSRKAGHDDQLIDPMRLVAVAAAAVATHHEPQGLHEDDYEDDCRERDAYEERHAAIARLLVQQATEPNQPSAVAGVRRKSWAELQRPLRSSFTTQPPASSPPPPALSVSSWSALGFHHDTENHSSVSQGEQPRQQRHRDENRLFTGEALQHKPLRHRNHSPTQTSPCAPFATGDSYGGDYEAKAGARTFSAPPPPPQLARQAPPQTRRPLSVSAPAPATEEDHYSYEEQQQKGSAWRRGQQGRLQGEAGSRQQQQHRSRQGGQGGRQQQHQQKLEDETGPTPASAGERSGGHDRRRDYHGDHGEEAVDAVEGDDVCGASLVAVGYVPPVVLRLRKLVTRTRDGTANGCRDDDGRHHNRSGRHSEVLTDHRTAFERAFPCPPLPFPSNLFSSDGAFQKRLLHACCECGLVVGDSDADSLLHFVRATANATLLKADRQRQQRQDQRAGRRQIQQQQQQQQQRQGQVGAVCELLTLRRVIGLSVPESTWSGSWEQEVTAMEEEQGGESSSGEELGQENQKESRRAGRTALLYGGPLLNNQPARDDDDDDGAYHRQDYDEDKDSPRPPPPPGYGSSSTPLTAGQRRACHLVATRANAIIRRCAQGDAGGDGEGERTGGGSGGSSGFVPWALFEESLVACGVVSALQDASAGGDPLEAVRSVLATFRPLRQVPRPRQEEEFEEVVEYPRMVFKLHDALNFGQQAPTTTATATTRTASASTTTVTTGKGRHRGGRVGGGGGVGDDGAKEVAFMSTDPIGQSPLPPPPPPPPPIRSFSPPPTNPHHTQRDERTAAAAAGDPVGGADGLVVVGRAKGGVALAFSWDGGGDSGDDGGGKKSQRGQQFRKEVDREGRGRRLVAWGGAGDASARGKSHDQPDADSDRPPSGQRRGMQQQQQAQHLKSSLQFGSDEKESKQEEEESVAAALGGSGGAVARVGGKMEWRKQSSRELLGKSINQASRAVAAAAAAAAGNNHRNKNGGGGGGGDWRTSRRHEHYGDDDEVDDYGHDAYDAYDGGGGGGRYGGGLHGEGGDDRDGSSRSERRWRAKRGVALQTLTQRRALLAALFRTHDLDEQKGLVGSGAPVKGRGCLGLVGLSSVLRSPTLDLYLDTTTTSGRRRSSSKDNFYDGGSGDDDDDDDDGNDDARRLALELLARVVVLEERRERKTGDGTAAPTAAAAAAAAAREATCDFNALMRAVGVEARQAVMGDLQEEQGSPFFRGGSSGGGGGVVEGVPARSLKLHHHHPSDQSPPQNRSSDNNTPPPPAELLDASIKDKMKGSRLDLSSQQGGRGGGIRSLGVTVRHVFKRFNEQGGGGVNACCRAPDLPRVLSALGVNTTFTPFELDRVASFGEGGKQEESMVLANGLVSYVYKCLS